MNNKIIVEKTEIKNNHINYQYSISGAWEEAFKLNEPFSIEYSCDISKVPESVAVVPLLANLLPIAWIYDAEIIVPVCDQDFFESIELFKQGYIDMFPMLEFKGKLVVKDLQKNVIENRNGSVAFFSGGVDAFNTLTCHDEEKPTLITLWGADVRFEDVVGWEKVQLHLQQTVKEFNVEYVTVKSAFRRFQDEGTLTEIVKESGDSWWHGFQHGIGIISHAAPIMYALGKETVYFASSFTAADKGMVTCASDPTIDNHVRFCGAHVIHDGYEFTRQMKVHNITQFAKRTGKNVSLRVCWESTGGSNCCNCEKCWRTILGVYAEGFDPKKFGFSYDNFDSVLKEIRKNQELLKWHRESRYAPMQAVLRQNYSEQTVNKKLRWFYNVNINRLGETPLLRKVGRKCKKGVKGVIRKIITKYKGLEYEKK